MTDRFVVRTVVLGLLILGLVFAGGIVYLSQTGHDHGILDNLVAVVVGALSGVLARTSSEPQEVTVTNPTTDPVPTADVPVKRKRRESGGILLDLLIVVLIVAAVAFVLGIR